MPLIGPRETTLVIGVLSACAVLTAAYVIWCRQKKRKLLAGDQVAEVIQLYTYPIKACRGLKIDSAECTKRGLKYDRCWTVAREQKGQLVALSQTQCPKLAMIQPCLKMNSSEELELHVTAVDKALLIVPTVLPLGKTEIVSALGLNGECQDVGDTAAAWFSDFLQVQCRLYYMKPSHRPRYFVEDSRYGPLGKPDEQASFSNRSSIMIASENALEDLNGRLGSEALPMNRFRPNVVIRLPESGAAVGRAYPEDDWVNLKIGPSVVVRAQRPCTRCPTTTVDQEEGVKKGPEPLRTLRTYRMYNGTNEILIKEASTAPIFGMCYGITKEGVISVGDKVCIL